MQSVGAKTLLMVLKNNRESGIQEMEFLVSLPICMHVCNMYIKDVPDPDTSIRYPVKFR